MPEVSDNQIYELIPAESPLLVNVPHAGTGLAFDLADRLRPEAQDLRDTDWHMDRIASAIRPDGAGLMIARQSRYVVDLNRSSDDEPLYAGATTGLISTIDFDGNPLYRPGQEPDAAERQERVAEVWEPYHAALRAEVDRIRAQFGYCLLLDLHSIRSRVPRLFDGTLPDLNLGTNSGTSASPELIQRVWKVLQETGFSAVKDARFRGGFITRHYGQPARNDHALQIEIAQCSYMEEHPLWHFDGERTEPLQAVLAELTAAMRAFRPLVAGKA